MAIALLSCRITILPPRDESAALTAETMPSIEYFESYWGAEQKYKQETKANKFVGNCLKFIRVERESTKLQNSFTIMAHQAHAIPWRSFASNFEYTTRPHIGPLPRLYVVESSNGLKDFQHFANVFAKRIREFGASERAKYASSESLKTRAEFWKKSDIDSEIDVSEVAPEMEGSRREEGRKAGQKSREPQVQGRKVYSDAFKAKYEIAYVDWPSYQIESKQDVANWTGSFDEGSCIDTLKILMMEAAAASLPFSDRVEGGIAQKQAMESLLLLANKRDVASSMRYWKHRGNGAHNYGIDMVAEKALCAYLMFNLFFSMRENGSGICKMEAGQAWPKERSCWYRAYMVPEETEALRPGYMNTHLWVNGMKSEPKRSFFLTRDMQCVCLLTVCSGGVRIRFKLLQL